MEETRQCRIVLNGQETSVPAGTTVRDLIERTGADPARVVAERNLEIVPAEDLARTEVSEGDSVELVRFVGGG